MQVLHLAVYLGYEDIDRIGDRVLVRQCVMDRVLAEIGERTWSVPTFLRLEDGSCTPGFLHHRRESDDWTLEREPSPPQFTPSNRMDRATKEHAIFS